MSLIKIIKITAFYTVMVIIAGRGDDGGLNQAVAGGDEFQLVGVNDVAFQFDDGSEGAVIVFKSDQLDKCRLSFAKDKFAEGYSYRVSELGEGNMDLTCLSERDIYALSPMAPTYVELNVLSSNSEPRVEVKFSLYGFKSKKILKKESVVLDLTSSQVRVLSGH